MAGFINKVDAGEQPTDIKAKATDENVLFVGYPDKNAEETDAKWAIKCIDSTDGITIKWAGGSIEKKHKWSEREALTYSRLS